MRSTFRHLYYFSFYIYFAFSYTHFTSSYTHFTSSYTRFTSFYTRSTFSYTRSTSSYTRSTSSYTRSTFCRLYYFFSYTRSAFSYLRYFFILFILLFKKKLFIIGWLLGYIIVAIIIITRECIGESFIYSECLNNLGKADLIKVFKRFY